MIIVITKSMAEYPKTYFKYHNNVKVTNKNKTSENYNMGHGQNVWQK